MRTADVALRLRAWLAPLALLALAAAPAFAQTAPAAVGLGPGSELGLTGTSTIHDYESKTSKLEVKFLRDAAQADPADIAALDAWLKAGGLKGLELAVPVATMRSGKDGLDKNMFKALRTSEFPQIKFAMNSSTFGTARGDTLPVTANGTLTVTDQQRPVSVKGHLVRTAQGVWLEGTHPMKMSEYGIKPPKMMMGTLKVHDPIVVNFRLLLVPAGATSTKEAAAH